MGKMGKPILLQINIGALFLVITFLWRMHDTPKIGCHVANFRP